MSLSKTKVDRQKRYNRKTWLKKRRAKEDYILDKTGGKCELCTLHWPSDVLCFHHLKPEDKEFELQLKNWTISDLNKVLEEADKCAILCMNCHALEHKALHRGETLINDQEAYSRYRNKRFSSKPSVDDWNERPSDTKQEGVLVPF